MERDSWSRSHCFSSVPSSDVSSPKNFGPHFVEAQRIAVNFDDGSSEVYSWPREAADLRQSSVALKIHMPAISRAEPEPSAHDYEAERRERITANELFLAKLNLQPAHIVPRVSSCEPLGAITPSFTPKWRHHVAQSYPYAVTLPALLCNVQPRHRLPSIFCWIAGWAWLCCC